MFRIVLIALVVGLSFELSGFAAGLGDPCEDCPNDRSGGECAPNCHACGCSVPRTVRSDAASLVLIAPPATTVWSEEPSAPPTVDPSDILHVPKFALA